MLAAVQIAIVLKFLWETHEWWHSADFHVGTRMQFHFGTIGTLPKVMKLLQEDMQHIFKLRKNAAVVLVLIGFAVGALAGLCICPRRVVVPSEKKKD